MARIAFLLPDMRGGGAERVALTLIEGILDRGHEVDLVLFQARGALMQLLPREVTVVDLAVDRMRKAIWPLARYLRERRPDALQASMWPVTLVAILARLLARSRNRLVVSDHNNITEQFRGQALRLKLIGWSIRLLYPLADARVTVSRDVAVDLGTISGLSPKLFDVVYNPIPQRAERPTLEADARWTGKHRRILSVGTLKRQKNHELLLRAFAILHRRGPANLLILGEGELRPKLKEVADELGIAEATSMPGFALEPAPYYATADIFVLSSDYEGFANVLVEAMASGISVVSTNCRSGPREILEDGQYGRLVPVGDAEALAAALEEALKERPDRERLKARAREFRPEVAVDRYVELMLARRATV